MDTHLMTEPGGGPSGHRKHLDIIVTKVSEGGTRTREVSRDRLSGSSAQVIPFRFHGTTHVLILAWVRVIHTNYSVVVSIVSASPLGMASVVVAEISRGC